MSTKSIFRGYLKLMAKHNFVRLLDEHLEGLSGIERDNFKDLWNSWCDANTPSKKRYRENKLRKAMGWK